MRKTTPLAAVILTALALPLSAQDFAGDDAVDYGDEGPDAFSEQSVDPEVDPVIDAGEGLPNDPEIDPEVEPTLDIRDDEEIVDGPETEIIGTECRVVDGIEVCTD